MKCEQIKALLNEYIDGALNINENEEIKVHLEECYSCAKEYELLSSIILASKELEEEPPDYLRSSVLSKIEQKEKKNKVITFKRVMISLTSTAAVAAIVLFSISISPNFLNNRINKAIDKEASYENAQLQDTFTSEANKELGKNSDNKNYDSEININNLPIQGDTAVQRFPFDSDKTYNIDPNVQFKYEAIIEGTSADALKADKDFEIIADNGSYPLFRTALNTNELVAKLNSLGYNLVNIGTDDKKYEGLNKDAQYGIVRIINQ